MPVQLLLIGLAVVLAVLAVVPAGRRLIATFVDVVDGSVAMFAIRRMLGLDTTTARQRRIDRRHAREQAEILRRIGATDVASGEPLSRVPSAPNRLVVSGGLPAADTLPAAPDPRRSLFRDGLVATLGIAIVVLAVSSVVNQPRGAVLGATASPEVPTGVVRASSDPALAAASTSPRSVAPAPLPSQSAAVLPSAAAPAPSAPTASPLTGPQVDALQARLGGRTAGGRTVSVTLAWTLRPGSVPARRFVISVRVGDRALTRVATVDGTTRSLPVTLGVGRTSTFRIEPVGPEGQQGVAVDWAPITPSLVQESSGRVSTRGPWRLAAGPSLSGGGVTFSGAAASTLKLSFKGTDIGWVATLTPMSGRAQVRLDGKLIDTVDLAATGVRYRQLVFRRHVAGTGGHVLEIRPLGDGRVDADAFVVRR